MPSLKRLALLPALALLASGCGWYTNIPASIYVYAVEPATVVYGPTDTRGVREIKVTGPTVTFQGEPGSIGANFDSALVTYRLSNQATSTSLPQLSLGLTFRVDSSNYPVRTADEAIGQATIGTAISTGRTTIALPVVTRHVEDFGSRATGGPATEVNAAAVTAVVVFTGSDDANLPVSLEARIPIFFSGTPGTGQ
jgi:hypothetical protein